MTDSNWAPFHDARHYQADALSGNVRSLPRTVNGRAHKGTDPLKPHPDADGYLRINYTDDNGVRHHGASRARCMLMAHDPGGYFEGAEACHGPGGRQDDRLANLRWDTSEANRIEALAVRLENSPPKPKPPKVCPRCGAQHRGLGQNCPACIDGLAVTAAALLAGGMTLDQVAEELGYPPVACYNLPLRRGLLAVTLSDTHPDYAPSPQRRLRSALFHRQASRQNSDAQ